MGLFLFLLKSEMILVLFGKAHSHRYPEIRGNVGNAAVEERLCGIQRTLDAYSICSSDYAENRLLQQIHRINPPFPLLRAGSDTGVRVSGRTARPRA